MMDRLRHRGPDAGGLIDMSPGTALQLGHRRLSIIDLSAAADQPFSNDGLHLTYNGEPYNFCELCDALRGRGVQFRTESDTEVMLDCWRQWGSAGLERLRGMFAFAIYDEARAALTLVRDPLGIKPLYVPPRGRGILFASELKAMVAAGFLRQQPLGQTVADQRSCGREPSKQLWQLLSMALWVRGALAAGVAPL
jgi:asparagine synthase (glutamine-hydrolysing)